MNTLDFAGFVAEIHRNGWSVHGAEAWRDGELVAAFGDTQTTRFPVYSITKSLVSIAVGIASDEGRLHVDDGILRYLPEQYVKRMNAAQREAYAPITLRRLMSMSVAGFPFAVSGEDWLEDILNLPLRETERRAFEYSNIPAYLVSVAVTEAVGERLDRFLDRRLFAPLDVPTPPCQFSPDGYFYGATGLELTVNELSRIGLMLSHGGSYKGRRIVSEAYVRSAVSVQQMNREGGYGLFFWKYRNGFSMNGKYGQKCYVLPEQSIMVSFLSHLEEGSDGVRACMERHLLGG